MTATNHALTGAVIGLAVGNPWLALPAALASHFFCDALPHFDLGGTRSSRLVSGAFRRILYADMSLCVVLALLLTILQPHHWWLAVICAFLATSPDLVWLPEYVRARRGKPAKAAKIGWKSSL